MADPETTPEPAEQPDAMAGGADATPAEDAIDEAADSASATGDAFADALLASTEAAINDATKDDGPKSSAPSGGGASISLPDFGAGGPAAAGDAGLDLLSDVSLNVKIELGRTRMYVEDVLRLSSGAVVELDKLAGDPVDIYVNDRRVARGEVLVVNDNFCVRVSEIVAAPGDDEEN